MSAPAGWLSVAHGQPAVLEAPYPLTLSVAEASASNAETLGTLSKATISLFGLLPLREVDVRIADDLRLYPGGQAVGVALRTKGVLVVAKTGGMSTPLRPGDVILSVGGEEIASAKALARLVNAAGSDHGRVGVAFLADDLSAVTGNSPLILGNLVR